MTTYYVVLDPESSEPTFGAVEDAVIVDGPDNAEAEDIRLALQSAIRTMPARTLLDRITTAIARMQDAIYGTYHGKLPIDAIDWQKVRAAGLGRES